MTETSAEYTVSKDEASDALEMLGKGYKKESSLEIHQQHVVIRRDGWSMREEVVPAFVKVSTSFKAEMKNIDGTAIKVWLYLALSINRHTGQAHPGTRKISEDCGMSRNTVMLAIKKLEALGLLLVNRKDKKYNLYEMPDFVSANKSNITGSKTEPDAKTGLRSGSNDNETGSIKNESGSVLNESGSELLSLNQINQINQNETRKKKSPPQLLFWDTLMGDIKNDPNHPPASRRKIALGHPVTWLDGAEKTLVVEHPDPEWANQRWSRILSNLMQGLCPGGRIEFE